MKTIVVGFDGSPAAERALERALEMTDAEGRIVIATARLTIPPASVVDEPILGSGYVTRALVGSTAENVVRRAPCDVPVVR